MKKHRLLGLVFLSIAVCLWMSGFLAVQEFRYKYQTARLYYSADSLTWDMLEKALEKEKERASFYHLLLWREDKDITAADPFSGRTDTLTLVSAIGDMYGCFPEELLAGNLISEEDVSGCMISRRTAQALFGSEDILGKKVVVQEKEYQVWAVVDQQEALFYRLVQDTKLAFPNMEFRMEEAGMGEELSISQKGMAESFISRNVLPQPVRIKDGVQEASWYGLLGRLPLLLAGILLVWQLYCVCSCLLKKRISRIIGKLFTFAVLMCGLFWFFQGTALPEEWIPTRWSDFSFYTEKFNETKAAWAAASELPARIFDQAGRALSMRCIWLPLTSILSGIIGIVLSYRFETKTKNEAAYPGRSAIR